MVLAAQINDYAARHYHGLMEFYAERWNFFFDTAENGCQEDDAGYKKFQAEILGLEQQFSNQTKWPHFTETEIEDYEPVVKYIWDKYGHLRDLLPPDSNDTT